MQSLPFNQHLQRRIYGGIYGACVWGQDPLLWVILSSMAWLTKSTHQDHTSWTVSCSQVPCLCRMSHSRPSKETGSVNMCHHGCPLGQRNFPSSTRGSGSPEQRALQAVDAQTTLGSFSSPKVATPLITLDFHTLGCDVPRGLDW